MSPAGLQKFVELFPDLIREAAKSPLGVVSLIVLLISLVTLAFFPRGDRRKLIGFILFLISLVALAFKVMAVYPAVEQEHRERTIGPGRVDLDAPAAWNDPVIRILGGTVITTNGNDLKVDAGKQLVLEGQVRIQSFNPEASLPPPPAKPPGQRGPDIPEARQCEAGRAGNLGENGHAGETGFAGKGAGKIS